MDFYIDEKDKELGRARLSQVGEGASARGGGARRDFGKAESCSLVRSSVRPPEKKIGPETIFVNHALTL